MVLKKVKWKELSFDCSQLEFRERGLFKEFFKSWFSIPYTENVFKMFPLKRTSYYYKSEHNVYKDFSPNNSKK